MRRDEASAPGGVPIDGFGPGFARLGGEVWAAAVLLPV